VTTTGEADSVNLKSKAVLIDVGKPRDKGSFQVTTPQAIAAVRGTKWAVDIQNTGPRFWCCEAKSRCESPPAQARSFSVQGKASMSMQA